MKAEWQRSIIFEREDVVALDSSIILNPRVWVASGHVGGFSDPLVECTEPASCGFAPSHIDTSACGRNLLRSYPGRDGLITI